MLLGRGNVNTLFNLRDRFKETVTLTLCLRDAMGLFLCQGAYVDSLF
jgi:hypothetical protein